MVPNKLSRLVCQQPLLFLHFPEPVRTEAVLPDRALCVPTFSHFLMSRTSLSPLPPSSPLSFRQQLLEFFSARAHTLSVSLKRSKNKVHSRAHVHTRQNKNCAAYYVHIRLRLVSIPHRNLPQNHIVLKCLKLNSTPCVQSYLKSECFTVPPVGRNTPGEYLPVAGSVTHTHTFGYG